MKKSSSPSSTHLIHGCWDKNKLKKIFEKNPPKALLPPYNSKAWNAVRQNPLAQKLVKPLVQLAKKECGKPLPRLTDSLYRIFHRTGDRLTFEVVYFERRRQFARAATAFLFAEKEDPWRGKYLKSLTAKLRDIFEEESWALPAHVKEKSGRDREIIDLFSAETANLMAESLDIFAEILPEGLCEKIRARLRDEVWDLYCKKSKTYWWSHGANNWNAVCHQGVVGSALSQDRDAGRLAELCMLAREGLPHFLKGYEKDGGTSEGPAYWEYGFGWYSLLNEQIEARTGGELSLFDGDGHIRKIAQFGPLVSLRNERFVNFSDGSSKGTLRPSLLSYLGKRLGEPMCEALARENYARLFKRGIHKEADRCDLLYLVRLFLSCPQKISTKETVTSDHFFPDLKVILVHGKDRRGHDWDFAAKAGHNAEHHNHNDCGSWILNIDGESVVSEIGAPEYVKDFFSPKRYGFLAARTLGHSLPIIHGQEQAEGIQYTSKILKHRMGNKTAEFSLDATNCYPKKAACQSFLRNFSFDKIQGMLRVEDRIKTKGICSIEDALISFLPIRIRASCAEIKTKTGTLFIQPTAGTKILRVEKHGYNDHYGKPARIYRLVYVPQKEAQSVSLGLELRFS